MKAAPFSVCACAIVLMLMCSFAPAAIVPLTSTVTFNLFGNDYVGPFAGIQRNPATVGPMPISQFPGITDSGVMFDPSPAALTAAQGNITFGSTGTNEFVLSSGVVVQPLSADSLSELRIDFQVGFVSVGATPAHVTNLSYIAQLEVYPPMNPSDPTPFALFDAIMIPSVNGVPAPDSGLLIHLQVGSTGGPVIVNIPGPDGSMNVPALNNGDLFVVSGQLSFKVSNASFLPIPEPATSLMLVTGAIPILLARRRRTAAN